MNNEYKENLSSELRKLVKAYYITLILSNLIFPDMITYLYNNVDSPTKFSKNTQFSQKIIINQ